MRFSSVLFCQPGATQSRKYTANFDGDRVRDGMHTVLCERVNPQWYAMLGITFHRGICVGAQLCCPCSVVVCIIIIIYWDPFPQLSQSATWGRSKWGNGAAPTDKSFLFAWPMRKFWKESCSTTVITFRSDLIPFVNIKTTRLVLI